MRSRGRVNKIRETKVMEKKEAGHIQRNLSKKENVKQ